MPPAPTFVVANNVTGGESGLRTDGNGRRGFVDIGRNRCYVWPTA